MWASEIVALARGSRGGTAAMKRMFTPFGLFKLSGAIGYALAAAIFYVGVATAYQVRAQEAYRFPERDIVAATTGRDDTFWIAPLSPYAYLEVGRMPASRYAFYLPWHADSREINQQLISDLERSQPPVVIFFRDSGILRREGARLQTFVVRDYAPVIDAYVSEHYVSASETDPRLKYLFFRRERAEELLRRLRDSGLAADCGRCSGRGSQQTRLI